MKRNFAVSLFGSLVGFGMLLIVLSATGIVGARGAAPDRAAISQVDSVAAAVVSSTFTYQGLLKKNGAPFNGACDLQFVLYDSPSAGSRIGVTQTVIGKAVSNGLFTQMLNTGGQFGANAFTGIARWLQIGVRCPTAVGGYTPLTTRQELTPVPYALYAAAPWINTGGNLSYSGGSITALDATLHSLYISTTAGIAMDAETRSGGEAVYAECMQSGNNCYALEGYAPTGDYAGYMYGGKGVYAESDDAAQPGLDGNAYGSNSYGVAGESASYRGGYFKSDSNVLYSLYVDDVDGPTQGTAALNVRGTIRGEGNLVIGGSKAGYVVDIMQNVDTTALEPGDVVVIVGNSAPVLGKIPVVTIKKATSAYDSGVAGIVDEVWYAPDPTTKTAYEAQETALRAAMSAQSQAHALAHASGGKPADVAMPEMKITDEQGTLHTLPGVLSAGTGGYVSVVTLGAYRLVKVDASYGAIHAGDLLTTSPHAGYAMKVTDKVAAIGAIIGKALGDLDSGTGTIAILVMPQ